MTTKIAVSWLFAIVLLFASAGTRAQTKSVTIFAYQQDETTQEAVESVREALRTSGFREGRNLKLTVADANGIPERATNLALELVRGRPDVFVALTLPAAQALLTHTTRIPVVFMDIMDPVASGLVANPGPSGTNVTGVLDTLPLQKRISLIKQVSGKARRIGVLYNPNDASSVSQVREFQEQLSAAGMIAIEVTVTRSSEVGSAARSLIEKVDAFQTFTDVTVSQSYSALAQVANEAKLPLFGWDVKDVRAGAVAALDLTDRDMGLAAGRLAVRILKGTNPGTIAPELIANIPVYVNLQAASKQSVELNAALSKTAQVLVK